jgi:uncharacterized protein YdhG (YjbR/CyaY superfamily)
LPAKKANLTTIADVERYLAGLPAESRLALSRLRRIIRSIVPDAIECISYQVPTFKYLGGLVGYAALPDHCSFFVMSPSVMQAHEAELKAYDTSKGTIRFPAGKPLPEALVKKLVRARVAENKARAARTK